MRLRQRLPFVGGHGAGLVDLGAHQVEGDAGRGVDLGLVEPLLHAGEGGARRDVVDKEDAVGAAVVRGGQGAEAFLAGLEDLVGRLQRLGEEDEAGWSGIHVQLIRDGRDRKETKEQ